MRRWLAIGICLMGLTVVHAQTDLAASLEVLSEGVSVQRVNTTAFIDVTKEAIVGVGDVIATDETGSARITFFADGTETDLLPGTRYQISTFSGDDQKFTLSVAVLVGQTQQRLGRILNAGSSYTVDTPGMTLAARGTTFSIKVQPTGRSAMLVTEGTVEAEADSDNAAVPAGFGVRADNDESLSDVVAATSFDELDAALDGCPISLRTSDDVSLNVRRSPSTDSEVVGFVSASNIRRVLGAVTSGQWYRIAFRGGFGWILSSSAALDTTCAGLRVFPTDQTEDASLYQAEDMTPPVEATPEVTPELTPEATPAS